jgi:hypothetical protein
MPGLEDEAVFTFTGDEEKKRHPTDMETTGKPLRRLIRSANELHLIVGNALDLRRNVHQAR